MTIRLADRGIRLVLLDIEGTTTPLPFVHEVLFPFAAARLGSWLSEHAASPEFLARAQGFAREHAVELARGDAPPSWHAQTREDLVQSVDAYARWLMARDRKSPALKELQGLIWEQGYQSGALRGLVFPDVPIAFARWRAAHVGVAIYSSGSELAQRRLFESTASGDLTPFISRFFDAAVGAKQESPSYARIASALELAPREMLFISDVTAELAAARELGYNTALSLRPGNAPQPNNEEYDAVEDFGAIG